MAIYLVTTTQDENDQGATVASPGGSGLSLREALALANADPAADTIRFADGAGEAFENGGSIFLSLPDQLEISSDVKIEGGFVTGNVDTAAGVQAEIGIFGASSSGANDADSRVFLVSGGNVVIEGILISGGDAGEGSGGGIFMTPDSSLELMYSVVSQNRSGAFGGGIYNNGGELNLTNVTVIANYAEFLGGGIAGNDGRTILRNSDLIGNSTGYDGGGVSVRNGGYLSLRGSLVSLNMTPKAGGGIYGNNAGIGLLDTLVFGNEADQGGGIYVDNGTTLAVGNSTIAGNSASTNGGGVYGNESDITLTNSTVANNYAQSGGAGFVVFGGSSLTLQNATVSGNYAGYGAAISSSNSSVTLTNSIVLANGDGVDAQIFGNFTNTGGLSLVGGADPADVFAEIDTQNGSGAGGLLAENGGRVPTIALLNIQFNPAIDAGDDELALEADARGLARIDFPGVANNAGNSSDLGAFEVQGTEARSLVVTTTADVVDGFDGETSLREAILFANNVGDADGDQSSFDTITFASGAGEAFATGGTIFLALGEQLVIESDIRIFGDLDDDGTPDITIDADSGAGLDDASDRVLQVSSGTAVIDGLVITNGFYGFDRGGNIQVANGAMLELINSTVSGGSANYGAGIFASYNATVELTGTTITGNTATTGGGIGGYGNVSLTDSTVSNNSANFGGGIAVGGKYTPGGTLNLTNSTVSDNEAVYGGGIANVGTAVLSDNTVISGNSADSSGGGILSIGTVLALNAVLLDSNTASDGAGIYIGGAYVSDTTNDIANSTIGRNIASSNGGGIFVFGETLMMVNTTIGENEAQDGAGIYLKEGAIAELTESTVSKNVTPGSGGGIFGNASVVDLTNSTVSGNAAESGGGIYNDGGFIGLTNATISGNEASFAGGGVYGTGSTITIASSTISGNAAGTYGGGVFNFDGSLTTSNSIVIGNAAQTEAQIYSSSEIVRGNGPSIIGGLAELVFAGIDSTTPSQIGGLLADNGGPVQTIALLASSDNPAIDASGGLAPETDARGNARFDFPGIDNSEVSVADLGAFELAQGELPSLRVTTTEDVVDAADGETSLREAVLFANSTQDADGDGEALDTITFADGVGEAFEGGGTIFLTQGNIEITSEIAIRGDLDDDDAPDVTINANSGPGVEDATDRIFTIKDTEVVLDGLILTGGRASNGGAIYSGDSNLGLYSVTITGNVSTSEGGGLWLANGDLMMSGSTISGNSSSTFGGGAIVDGESRSLIVNSTFSDNSTNGRGGGLFISGLNDTHLVDSTVSGNSAAYGGGIEAREATLAITGTTVSDNTASMSGGGVRTSVDTDLTVSGSVIDGNSAQVGGGIAHMAEDATIEDSTVSGNTAATRGGGIYSAAVSIAVTGSTISGNSTGGRGGGIYNNGLLDYFATDSASGALTLTDSTISGNSAVDGGGIGNGYVATFATNTTISNNTASGFGGGVINVSGAVNLANTTISGNDAANGGGIYNYTGTTSVINSIVLGNAAPTSAEATANVTNIDGLSLIGGADPADVFAQIDGSSPSAVGGLLADNGGPVQTIALLSDAANPALDAGDDSDAPAQDAAGFSRFDQQDVSNNGGNISDLGSFELQTQVGEEASLDPQWRLLTTDGFIGDFGGSGEIFGTGAIQNIGIVDLPGAIAFDPSFNRGGDIIRLPGSAADWTIMRFGSSAILSDGDTSTTIPLGTEGLLTIFDDGDRLLRFDTSDSTFRIGAQEFADAAVTITAPGQVLDFPIESFANPFGRLLFFPDGEVTAGANGLLDIVGTAGNETVTALFGDIQLDPSFNRGGDVLELILPAPSFTAVRIGSALKLESASTDVFVPLGTTGMTTIFNSADDRLIVFDTLAGTALVGTQPIGFDAAALSAIA